MRIDYVEFKNFASYGNQMQRIEFEEDQSKLFLTLGKNGDGKTTIANAIIYALYGRIEGVKLSDLPNRINKELHVKIGLMCGTVQVEVERGLLPNKFSVKLNGVEFDKAGKKSVQDYLEEEVYGIPYHVFKNIIILSVNDFKSFLTMSNQDKKQIIDKMFGFSILNDMQMSIKTERKNIKMDIDLYESELTQILDSIASVKGKLNTLLEESQEKNNSKIDELKVNLVELNESVKSLDIDKKSIDTEIDNKTEIFESTRSKASALKHEIEYLKRKLDLYKSGKCPTCETQLDSQWHIDQKEHFCSKIEKDTEKIKTLKETLDTVKLNIDTLKEDKATIERKASDIRYNMKTFKSELLKIKEAPDDSQFTHLKNLIKDFELKENTKSKSKDNLNADYAFMEIVEKVLGEDGVKNLAVKTILPGLNTNIAVMTQTMHLPFHIRFNEKFDCIINHLGEDINPMTLSTGERKKADFIIIIAIIKILKLRFPQLNLLFLDELLSSVDHDGVYNILKILNQVIK